jgi:hypothetical protein
LGRLLNSTQLVIVVSSRPYRIFPSGFLSSPTFKFLRPQQQQQYHLLSSQSLPVLPPGYTTRRINTAYSFFPHTLTVSIQQIGRIFEVCSRCVPRLAEVSSSANHDSAALLPRTDSLKSAEEKIHLSPVYVYRRQRAIG